MIAIPGVASATPDTGYVNRNAIVTDEPDAAGDIVGEDYAGDTVRIGGCSNGYVDSVDLNQPDGNSGWLPPGSVWYSGTNHTPVC